MRFKNVAEQCKPSAGLLQLFGLMRSMIFLSQATRHRGVIPHRVTVRLQHAVLPLHTACMRYHQH